jgi:hypothetical protein
MLFRAKKSLRARSVLDNLALVGLLVRVPAGQVVVRVVGIAVGVAGSRSARA